MTKPIEYCREVRVPRETPFQMIGEDKPLDWLSAGRVVWLRPTECAQAATKLSAFADGIGMIAVRRKYLAA